MAIVPEARRLPGGRAGQEARSSSQEKERALATRLREIGESAASPEDALDPMLRAILESTGAAAGALCLYDVRVQMLRLAAESGLSDEGCRRLRIVRRGDGGSWEMPLHSMLSRRVYLIENAAQNRFVPPLVEDAAKVASIVCIPLYSKDETPLASVVLITLTPRSLGEREIQGVEAPLLEMGRLIEKMRERAVRRETRQSTAAPLPGSANAPREERETHPAVGASAEQEVHAIREIAHTAERARAAAVAEAAQLRVELDRVRLEAARAPAAPVEVEARLTQSLAEIDRLRARLAEAEAGAAHEQRAREELEARLTGGVAAGQQELRKALKESREAERARAAAVAETARLHAELDRMCLEVVSDPSAARERSESNAPLLVEIDRLRARLAEAEAGAAHEHRAREELESRFAAGGTAGQQELRHAFEAARSAEQARATAASEVVRLSIELDRARLAAIPAPELTHEADARATEMVEDEQVLLRRSQRLAAQLAERDAALRELREEKAVEVGSLSAGLEALVSQVDQLREARVAVSAERDRLAADLEGAAVRRAHLEEALQRALDDTRVHERELQSSRAQTWGFSARLVEAEAKFGALREEHTTAVISLSARFDALEAEADRLREAAAQSTSERDRLAAALEGETAAKAHFERVLRETLDETRARTEESTRLLHEARSQAWSAATQLAETEAALGALRDEWATEVGSLSARVETLSAEADQLRRAQAVVGMERDHLAADLAGAHAAQARLEETLQQALQESRTREEALAARLVERDRELASLGDLQRPSPEPVEKVAPQVPGPPPRSAAAPSPGVPKLEERRVAVLDGDPAWGDVNLDKYEVIVLAPGRDLIARLEEARPGRVVGNLAVPGVFQALLSIREALAPMRLWGCIADGAADRALRLGLIEPAARPLAPDAVVASLSSHGLHATRVVTVGADVDALLSLRQALTRNGMSVSMAWDAKQAPELVDMVRPGVVVADLGMRREACALVARLAGTNPLPLVVLIEGTDDPAATFAASLGDRALAQQVTSLESLLAAVLSGGDGRQPHTRR